MPDAAENRLTASLTMCRKAGKLLLGFDAVKEAAKQGSVKLFLLSADASAKTEKEIRFLGALKTSKELLMSAFSGQSAFGTSDRVTMQEIVRLMLDEAEMKYNKVEM